MPITPATPRNGVYDVRLPATGRVMEGMRTKDATTGLPRSATATFKMSAAVDTDAPSTPLASAKCDWPMPRSAAAAFILATKAGMLPASHSASMSAVIVR